MNKFLIIIPAYNEASNIGKILDLLKGEDVLVVNDCSSDNTADIVKSKGIKCISHKENKGYCKALQTGYRYALEHDYDYVIQMDADGQHDACNIEKLKAVAGEADIILGSRFLKDSNSYKTGVLHKLGYKWFSYLLKILTHKDIKDTSTGLQCLNRRTFAYYSRYFDEKYPDANILVRMILRGFSVKEMPATMHPRESGKSMHSGIEPVKYLLIVTKNCFRERHQVMRKEITWAFFRDFL